MTEENPRFVQGKRPWSIASLLRREERNWVKCNPVRRRLRYRWFEREILNGGEHPFRYAFSLSVLLVLIIVLGYLVPADWFVGHWSLWDSAERLNYFTTLWSVQTTIVALVYPIVISFVALLLQRRPASKAFLQIYLLDSGALVAGLSSLSLVLAMAMQYVMLATYSLGYLVTWTAVDGIWFVYNVILTIWFLFRTVEFLRPDFQIEVVRRYVANIALPREVANLLRLQFFANAQKMGWMPGPAYLDKEAEGEPHVLMPPYGMRMGVPSVQRYLSDRARLTNVFYWPLRLAVNGWLKRARKLPKSKPKNTWDKPEPPQLVLSALPGSIYEASVILASVDRGPELSGWQRLLVRVSFWFTPARLERRQVSLMGILADLETDAREAVTSGDVPGFEVAYPNLMAVHESLLGASLTKAEDGSAVSCALIPNIHKFFERPIHVQWVNSYQSLFKAAVGLLPNETRPFELLCHVVQHLNGEAVQNSPEPVRKEIMLLPTRLMRELGSWWSLRAEEQGTLQHGHNQMALLRPPLQGAYEGALVRFVSGWGTARHVIAALPSRDDEFSWSACRDLLTLNATHIEQTALMLLHAVNRGDRAGAEWMADVFSKWWADASRYDPQPFVLRHKSDFITTESVNRNWKDIEQSLGLDVGSNKFIGSNDMDLQRHVFLAALKNYWRDIRLLTLEILLSWAAGEQAHLSDDSLAIYIASGLLAGREWRAGGRVEESLKSFAAPQYLTAKARQYAADSSYRQSYVARLNSFVASAMYIKGAAVVFGRIYPLPANDVESLQEAQLIIFAVLSNADWTPNDALRRQLAVWISSDFQSSEILRERAEAMKNRLDTVEDELAPGVIDRLIELTNKRHTRSEGVARTSHGINALLEQIVELQSDAVARAPISGQRLKDIEEAASSLGFVAETGDFPLQLFKDVTYSSGDQDACTLIIPKLPKGELTDDEMAQRSINERDYYAESVANHVGLVLLSDVIRGCKVRDIAAPNASAYWLALKEEAAKITRLGLTPVLILDNPTRPDWVWDWEHLGGDDAYPRPLDLVVRRGKNRGANYICDFNSIQVFSGPLPPGESLLLTRETFVRVTFTAYRDAVFVKAAPFEVPDSQTLIDLRLTYARTVEVAHPHIVRIRYDINS